MSPKEKIAKLEGFLARVKERAEVPRRSAAAAIAPAPMVEAPASPGLARKDVVAAPAPAVQIQRAQEAAKADITPAALPRDTDEGVSPPTVMTAPPDSGGWSQPPATTAEEQAIDGMDLDVDVEVSAEVVEVEIDIDEPVMPAESGAHAVAEPHPPDEPAAELEPVEAVDAAAADQSAPETVEAPPANEVEEPAPSSSPRPITSETPAYEAEEEESAPRHTPPPESGKQVAATPSVKPDAGRKSSVPPPSEGHTLLGGWQQAANLAREGLRSPAGVRVPPPPPPPPAEQETGAAARAPSVGPPPTLARPAGPEVTKADLPAVANVATMEGDAPSFAPSTFGDLLEASLGI